MRRNQFHRLSRFLVLSPFLVVASSVFLLSLTGWADTSGESERGVAVRRLIDLEMRWSGIPGMSVAVIADGTPVYAHAYGLASVELRAPLTTSTVFQLSSTSKAFTGIAAMMLVKDGKLELDAPVERYIGGLPNSWRRVTVRQLLNHTSGLPEVLQCDTPSREEALACVTRLPVDADPGETFRYNQTNYLLALMVIEHLGGTTFPEFMETQIFSRCGMVSTSYAGSNLDVVPGRATSYYPDGAGGLKQRDFDFPEYLYSAAGLNSNLEDLTRFAAALTTGRLVGDEELNAMWKGAVLTSGEASTYGLGWDLERHGDGGRSAGHEGGRLTTIRHFIDQRITVIVLSNGYTWRFNPDDVARRIGAVFRPLLMAPTDALRGRMIARLVENDLDGALAVYSTFVRGGDGSETDTEEMINSLGYQLLDRSDPAAAAAVLSLNVDRYPESANAHDSLGEALAASGDRAAAIDHYRESLRLDPSNRNAEEMIDRLEE